MTELPDFNDPKAVDTWPAASLAAFDQGPQLQHAAARFVQ
jgi:hypothetical protein